MLACPLDWDEDVPGLSADVILGSDVCYDPEAVPSLVRLLGQLLRGVTHQHPQAASQSPTSSTQQQQEQQEQVGNAQQPCPQPVVAYISTTRRQDSTLQLFLDLCDQAGLVVEDVDKDPAAWVAVSNFDSEAAVVFQELPALQDGRDCYVLHRVSRR